MKKHLTIIVVFITISVSSYAQKKETEHIKKKFHYTNGTFQDARDGKVYKTITFIKEYHSHTVERTFFAENLNFAEEGSLCYKNISAYCKKFGRLYNFEQAMYSCPKGWHMATIHEWKFLFDFFGGWHHSGKLLHEGEETNMKMLYGGFGQSADSFKKITMSGNWWCNEMKDSNTAGIITLKKDDGKIYHYSKVKDTNMVSCRCVKFHN